MKNTSKPVTVTGRLNVVNISLPNRFQVECENPTQRRAVQRAVSEFPFLIDGICSLQWSGHRVFPHNILRTAETLRMIHAYPSEHLTSDLEAVNSETVLHMLKGGLDILDKEIFEDLTKLIPEISGEYRYKLRANGSASSLTVSICPKHSGAFYEVHFHGKEFIGDLPVTVRVVAYCDMDDYDNHGDECPARLHSSLEEELEKDDLTPEQRKDFEKQLESTPEDCNCESFTVSDVTFRITKKMGWDDKVKAKVARKIDRAMFTEED